MEQKLPVLVIFMTTVLMPFYFSDIISNCEQELFAKADNLFSDDGILSHLETDQLMEDDVSYDFLNLPNNLVDLKQESKLSFNLPNNLAYFNHESKLSSNLSNNLVGLKQEPHPSPNHSNNMLDLKEESNLSQHKTTKTIGSLEDPRQISLPCVPFDSAEKYTNKSLGFVSPNSSITSPPQVVPKHLKSHENPSKVVPQTQSYVLQQPQQYRNIQPNPATVQAAPIHAVKPHSHRKSKSGSNVVTVQSMGQIHVPADQMKQVIAYKFIYCTLKYLFAFFFIQGGAVNRHSFKNQQ